MRKGDPRIHDEIDLVGHHRLQGRRGTSVGHMDGRDSGLLQEQLADQVGGGTSPGGRVSDLSGIPARMVDQLRDVLGRETRADDHVQLEAAKAGDRQQIGRWVDRRLVQEGVGRLDRGGRDQHGVAVGRGAGHLGHGDVAGRAGAVVDHHRHAEHLGQGLCHDARDHVRRTTRREADHQLDRLVRPARLRQGTQAAQAAGGRQAHAQPLPTIDRYAEILHSSAPVPEKIMRACRDASSRACPRDHGMNPGLFTGRLDLGEGLRRTRPPWPGRASTVRANRLSCRRRLSICSGTGQRGRALGLPVNDRRSHSTHWTDLRAARSGTSAWERHCAPNSCLAVCQHLLDAGVEAALRLEAHVGILAEGHAGRADHVDLGHQSLLSSCISSRIGQTIVFLSCCSAYTR